MRTPRLTGNSSSIVCGFICLISSESFNLTTSGIKVSVDVFHILCATPQRIFSTFLLLLFLFFFFSTRKSV